MSPSTRVKVMKLSRAELGSPLEKYLALFGDLIGLQRYAKTKVESDRRRILLDVMDNMQMLLTNGLINWKKVNIDIETIQDR